MWRLALGRKPDQRNDALRVKELALAALGWTPDVAVSVTEIVCRDPGCPGTETILLVMAPGRKTAACKVSKPMAEVTDDDVRDALLNLAYAP